MFKATTTLRKIQALSKRLRIVQGGSSAGKTVAILLILIDKAQREPGKLISVVSETMPHLKRGAIRNFLAIMEEHGYFKRDRWNKTDFIYEFETGSKIEFFSVDSADKVRGPRRDVLFENECNNISYDTHVQLAIRTNEEIYLDYNPVSEFWVHDEIIKPGIEHDFLILTFKDNEAIPTTIKQEIESRRDNKYFWTVYGEGQIGSLEGRIYDGWRMTDTVPEGAVKLRRGLDFGFTNDPTSLIDVYRHNGRYILDEVIYEKGLRNSEVAEKAKGDRTLIIADSSEPKSIHELSLHGLSIIGARKGQDSLRQGIQLVQNTPISVTKRSVNLISEYRRYMWKTDRDGRFINEPQGGLDHALDAARYALVDLLYRPPVQEPTVYERSYQQMQIDPRTGYLK